MIKCECVGGSCKGCATHIKLLQQKIKLIQRYHKYRTTVRNTEQSIANINNQLKLNKRDGIYADDRNIKRGQKKVKVDTINCDSSDEEEYNQGKIKVSFQ